MLNSIVLLVGELVSLFSFLVRLIYLDTKLIKEQNKNTSISKINWQWLNLVVGFLQPDRFSSVRILLIIL